MEWKTRVTELLGCKYPIVEGAFAGEGTWQLAAAVAKAGAHGTITAAASRTPEQLRDDIKRCRDATDGSFGVNISVGVCPQLDKMLEVCIQERVVLETSTYKPDALVPRIKEAGLKWIHKVALVKDALYAEKLGADAVILVGLEGYVFKTPSILPIFTTITWGARQVSVPIIAAGGIGDAHGFLGALGMGAEGIMMGSAFLVTKESTMKDRDKEATVQLSPDNPHLRHRVLSSPDLKRYEQVIKMRSELPLEEWVPMLRQVALEAPDADGTMSKLPPVSLAAAAIEHVPTVKELIDSIIYGAEEILDSWEFLKTR
jgi:NAD(P)H-dependent flavin oxidoreductase YrpB (nitropropane dioxygenase family)